MVVSSLSSHRFLGRWYCLVFISLAGALLGVEQRTLEFGISSSSSHESLGVLRLASKVNLHGGKYGRIISVKIVYILSVYNGQLRVKCISVSGLIGFKVFLVARFNITFAAP